MLHAIRAGLRGQLIPVLVGVLLGVAVVFLHGNLAGHSQRHLQHPFPSPPPVRPLHLVAEGGRLHMISEPQPQSGQPRTGQVGTLDFSAEKAKPKRFQATPKPPFNERQNALLEVLRKSRERKQRERQVFQLPQGPPEGSPALPQNSREPPPAADDPASAQTSATPLAGSVPPSTFLHFLAAARGLPGPPQQPASLRGSHPGPASGPAPGDAQQQRGQSGPIMLSIADEQGVSGLLPHFVGSLRKAAPLLATNLVVICITREAYQACADSVASVTCFLDAQAAATMEQLRKFPAKPVTGGKGDAPNRVKDPLFLQLGWTKLERMATALELQQDVLFVDLDIVWMADPLPSLQGNAAQVQLTHDGWGPNIGLMYLRPGNATQALMRTWVARRTAPDSRDQYELQAAIEEASKQEALSVHYLDKAIYPNGCCCGHDLPSDPVQAQRWVMWHSACTGDLTTKVKVLERIGSGKPRRSHRKGA